MTVSSETRKAGPYACDGVDTTFDFEFKVFAAADVRVVLTTSAGVESDLTLNAVSSGFTVSLNADQDNDPGGTVTTTEAHAAGNTITITSDVADTQGTQLPAGGGWSPRVVERALDRLTILVQQVRLLVTGALRQPVSDSTTIGELPTKTARANKYLKFDADGDPEVDDSVVPETATVSAFMETVLDDTTAAAARTTLGAAASGANTDITSVFLNNTGLKVKDTNASHGLSFVPGSNITADRTLTVTTGDADRTLDLGANLTVTGAHTLAGNASQAEAEAGADNTKMMTPLRTAQAISALGSANGALRNLRVYTAGATWTKPAGLARVVVEVQGGGNSGGTGQESGGDGAGGGGGAGGYALKVIEAGSLGSTETVTIGNSSGGTTSFGAHVSATGGSAGSTGTGGQGTGGAGGSGSGGDVNINGERGSPHTSGFTQNYGGDSRFGRGGMHKFGDGVGNNASGYGAGGSGGVSSTLGVGRAGGSGTGGICLVWEYY